MHDGRVINKALPVSGTATYEPCPRITAAPSSVRHCEPKRCPAATRSSASKIRFFASCEGEPSRNRPTAPQPSRLLNRRRAARCVSKNCVDPKATFEGSRRILDPKGTTSGAAHCSAIGAVETSTSSVGNNVHRGPRTPPASRRSIAPNARRAMETRCAVTSSESPRAACAVLGVVAALATYWRRARRRVVRRIENTAV